MSEPTNDPPHHRLIDLRPALHEAGHEVHDMGWDGVPDSAPLLHSDTDGGGSTLDALDQTVTISGLD